MSLEQAQFESIEETETRDYIFPLEIGSTWNISSIDGFPLARFVFYGNEDTRFKGSIVSEFADGKVLSTEHVVFWDRALRHHYQVIDHGDRLQIIAPEGATIDFQPAVLPKEVHKTFALVKKNVLKFLKGR